MKSYLLLLALASFADAATLPRLRGPNGGGIGEPVTVPFQWTTNDYNWRVKLPGVGHFSPVELSPGQPRTKSPCSRWTTKGVKRGVGIEVVSVRFFWFDTAG